MGNLLQDVRFAIRQIRRSPGFAVTAVLVLALGITANVVVLGVLQGLILRPVDLPHADRVMTLAHTNSTYPIFNYPEIRDVRDANTVFSAVAALMMDGFGMEANGVSRPAMGVLVSGQYFEVAGIKPFLGRVLNRADDDDHARASNVLVLSWAEWNANFGADPNVLGKAVRLNKHPFTVVGVTPKEFYGTEKFIQFDFFVPLANQALLSGASTLDQRAKADAFSIVRLKEGVTLAQAQAELTAIAARITREHPKEEEKLTFKLTRPGLMGEFLGGPVNGFLAGVMVLAAIVLLAACANLGSLFAARTADRAREIAIRIAIGSSRSRIFRQILSEALVLALPGGAFACLFAWSALEALADWRPPVAVPFRFMVEPQPSLIVFAFVVSVFAGVVFSLLPLRQIFNTDPNDAIKSGNTPTLAGRRWAVRDVLLAAQIALCCVTVTAAFVSFRGLSRVMTMDLGFNLNHAVRADFDLSQAGYTAGTADQFQRRLLQNVLSLPGVQAAGYGNGTPLGMNPWTTEIFSQDASDFRPSKHAFVSYHYNVSPGYLAASGTTLLAGRDIRFADTAQSQPVAIVNQKFVSSLFHTTENPIGRYFKDSKGVVTQIVGLVPDGKYISLSEDASQVVFTPISQTPDTKTMLIVRTLGDPAQMAGTIRKMVREMDEAIPINAVSDWSTQLTMSFLPARVATIALGLFGALGLLLSVTGTFGVASYTVTKRLRELSIRVALGAQGKQILGTALGRLFIMLAGGSAVGMLMGIAISRLLSAIVYHASAQDPVVLFAVLSTTAVAGMLSVASPVLRALRADPANLLREH